MACIFHLCLKLKWLKDIPYEILGNITGQITTLNSDYLLLELHKSIFKGQGTCSLYCVLKMNYSIKCYCCTFRRFKLVDVAW